MKILLLLALSFSAVAHIKMGLYKGTKEDGTTCSMFVNLKYYKHPHKSPFNEVVHVYAERRMFQVAHPSNYDFSTKAVSVDKDRLIDIYTDVNGLNAFELSMLMPDGSHAVSGFKIRVNDEISYTCSDLEYQSAQVVPESFLTN